MLTDKEFNQIFPFDVPRKHQREIINNIIKAFEVVDYVILQAPTGIGKSVIADSVSNYLGTSYILTSQKMLQEQYFNDLQIPYVQGKSNYVCRKNSKLTCEMGVCDVMNSKNSSRGMAYKCPDCPYICARDITYKSPKSNLNYSYFLSACGTDFQLPRKLIVLDECHNLENELINSHSLSLNIKDMSFHGILISFPQTDDAVQLYNWVLGKCTDTLMNYLETLQDQIDGFDRGPKNKFYYKTIKDINYIKEILKKVDLIKSIPLSELVVQKTKDEITIKLLYGFKLFDSYIKPFGQKFLCMSATVFNKNLFCNNLGIDPQSAVFINCPSTFPKENRPIYIDYVGKMTYKEKDKTYPKLKEKVKQILDKHSNVKGIIHTVNYEVADYLYSELNDSRLILPKGKDRAEKLDLFLNSGSDEPYVLISPSLTEGIDLKEDLSRFCIICKVPYRNIQDQWVKKRMEFNYDWYINTVIETLVQMTGRSIRSETDFAESYILDQSFESFLYMNGNKFPKWWVNSIIR